MTITAPQQRLQIRKIGGLWHVSNGIINQPCASHTIAVMVALMPLKPRVLAEPVKPAPKPIAKPRRVKASPKTQKAVHEEKRAPKKRANKKPNVKKCLNRKCRQPRVDELLGVCEQHKPGPVPPEQANSRYKILAESFGRKHDLTDFNFG